MTLIATATNKMVDPLAMSVEDIDREDIIVALSKTCRWGGMCSAFLSVAQHSINVSDRAAEAAFDADPEDRMKLRQYALLHDAAEAYLGDVRAPIKHLPEFAFYRKAEHELLAKIHRAAGLDEIPPLWVQHYLHLADQDEQKHEWNMLMGGAKEWTPLEWRDAERLYRHRLDLCLPGWTRR